MKNVTTIETNSDMAIDSCDKIEVRADNYVSLELYSCGDFEAKLNLDCDDLDELILALKTAKMITEAQK